MLLASLALTSGCASWQTQKPVHHRQRPAPPPPADPEAQKKAYDQGEAYFGEEKYLEARKAWQEAVRLGPATLLAKKAQENLQKVDSILKSLKELQQQ